ncbi:hypothetical protein M0813_12741 [Anaeramoeba flamelloides]|uniref:Ankyrin repeat protein n=1 Tax=Anaeramoeba flamelloides TaxID=1746091 RepID=A0ABQ8ZBC5_9EUKA|nr:hypothetical protein M0813_12741 [Anaeramoeba flamelloides]
MIFLNEEDDNFDHNSFLQQFPIMYQTNYQKNKIDTFSEKYLKGFIPSDGIIKLALSSVVQSLPHYKEAGKYRLVQNTLFEKREAIYKPKMKWRDKSIHSGHLFIWSIDVIFYFLGIGVSPNHDNSNQLLLDVIRKGTPTKIIERILKAGCDPQLDDKFGENLIYRLCRSLVFEKKIFPSIEYFSDVIGLLFSYDFQYQPKADFNTDALSSLIGVLRTCLSNKKFCQQLILKQSASNCPKMLFELNINSSAKSIKKVLDNLIKVFVAKGGSKEYLLREIASFPTKYKKIYFNWITQTYNIDINKPDQRGGTFLMKVCMKGDLNFLKYLRKKKKLNLIIDEKQVDESNCNFFLMSCLSGNVNLLRYLIEELQVVEDFSIKIHNSEFNGLHFLIISNKFTVQTLKYLCKLQVFDPKATTGDNSSYLVLLIRRHVPTNMSQKKSEDVQLLFKACSLLIKYTYYDPDALYNFQWGNNSSHITLDRFLRETSWTELADHINNLYILKLKNLKKNINN